MSQLDRTLKKIGQERAKGNLERAFQRAKEAISDNPREFGLAREAASLAFETGQTLEAATILRAALKRFPDERSYLLGLAREEFERTPQLEVAELLYDAYLSEPDFDRARSVVLGLHDVDRDKLLAKLRAKIDGVHMDVPEERQRLVGLLLAEAVALSALGRSEEVASTLRRILEHDVQQTEVVGRLGKIELHTAPDNLEIRLLLARCYLNVNEPDLAAEQTFALADRSECRERLLEFVKSVPSNAAFLLGRALIELLEDDFGAAHTSLLTLLQQFPGNEVNARRTIERVPNASRATNELRLLYARLLGGTSAQRRAIQELQELTENGADAAAMTPVLDDLLAKDASNVTLIHMRAKAALKLGQYADASRLIHTLLECDKTKASELRNDVQATYKRSNGDPEIGQTLVQLLIELESPNDAVQALSAMHASGRAAPQILYELSGSIASKYGLSATLAALFSEAALDVGRSPDARAAVSHYMAFPDAHVEELMQGLAAMVDRRPDLAAKLAHTLQGMPIPGNLQLRLIKAQFDGDDISTATRALEALTTDSPDLGHEAVGILDAYLSKHGERRDVLELASQLLARTDRLAAAAEYLARALRAAPEAADRICKAAESVLGRAATRDEVWRPIVLALLDTRRWRHAKELCCRAAQLLPAQRQGFIRTAMGLIHLDERELASAANEFDAALFCEDAPIEHIVDGLRRAVDMDAEHGLSRLVLALALLRRDGGEVQAVEHLAEAARLDQNLVPRVLDVMREHSVALAQVPTALIVEGTLCLERGDAARGVAILEDALRSTPQLAANLLPPLQNEWDRNPDQFTTGIALAAALRAAQQPRRSCRLLADLARRFPSQQDRCIRELQALLQAGSLPEVHRTLWELYLQRGDSDTALQYMQQAVDTPDLSANARRELLDAAHQRMPASTWVTCRMADLEIEVGNEARAESVLRSQLERDIGAQRAVLDALAKHKSIVQKSEPLARLEVDALLAGSSWNAALEALRRFRAHFTDATDVALERYRVLVHRGATQGAADLDLAQILREQGRAAEAAAILEHALQDTPSDDPAAGRPKMAHGRGGGPLLHDDVQVHIADKNIDNEIRLTLASLYMDLGRERDGRAILMALVDRQDNKTDTLRFLEQVTHKSIKNKLKQLRDTIALAPGNVRARLELARLAILAADFALAREALRFDTRAAAEDAARRYLLARTYAEQDRPQLAAAVASSIHFDAALDPELAANARYLHASCNEKLGRFAEAHALYSRIVSMMPGFKDAEKRAQRAYENHLTASFELPALAVEKQSPFGTL